jgi:hypothetical protein
MPTDQEALNVGVSPKNEIRQTLIEWRDNLLASPEPMWDLVVLLSHTIWWLSDGNQD